MGPTSRFQILISWASQTKNRKWLKTICPLAREAHLQRFCQIPQIRAKDQPRPFQKS